MTILRSQQLCNVQVCGWTVILSGALVGVWAQPAGAVEASQTGVSPLQATSKAGIQTTLTTVPELNNQKNRPATTLKEWIGQIEAMTVQVIGVNLSLTDTGLEISLQTVEAKPLAIDASRFRTQGLSLVAEIPNAVLTLLDGQEFIASNPTTDISSVRVTQVDANRIGVIVTGNNALPKSTVTLRVGKAIYSLSPKPTQPEEDTRSDVEIVVTGAGGSPYVVPDASTATKTDTPVRDIPASIQVVPRQLLDDQNTIRIQEALENVSGVQKQGNYGGTDAGGFVIRGFAQDGSLRNGFADIDFYSQVDTANIERIEVLKGPPSVLYGQAEPGGIINIITKQPLRNPYYSAEINIGNYDFYRPSFDISGPLAANGSLLYRLNVAYQNSQSFRDFNFTDRIFVAPVITWNISDRTTLTFDLEYLNNNYLFDRGLPSLGDRPAPIPISRLIGLPESIYDDSTFRAGYRFEHRFNQDWQLRSGFSFVSGQSAGTYAIGGYELIDDQFAPIYVGRDDFSRKIYTLQTELVGRFKTGSVIHQPLVGVELRRNVWKYTSFDVADPILLDIFNPNYDVELPDIPGEPTFTYTTQRDTLGIYLQDQITLRDNLKLLVGGRFDLFRRKDDFGTPESETLTAFNPRLGIVYQPIQPISFYANYARSFQPDRFLGRSITNEPFKPTEGEQYEIGVKADISSRLAATLAAFQITKTNVLTPDPNDPNFSIQVGEQRSRGIELDISGEILPGWNIIASYAYIDAIVSNDNDIPVGNRLIDVPRQTASLWTTYILQSGYLKGLGFGLGLYYVGDRYADLLNTSILPSYFRVDSAIYYRRDKWKLALNFRNLFNETYYETSQGRNIIYPGAPFTVIGSFSIQF